MRPGQLGKPILPGTYRLHDGKRSWSLVLVHVRVQKHRDVQRQEHVLTDRVELIRLGAHGRVGIGSVVVARRSLASIGGSGHEAEIPVDGPWPRWCVKHERDFFYYRRTAPRNQIRAPVGSVDGARDAWT